MRWWGEGGLAPARHGLSLPLWCPKGGLPLRGTGYPRRCGKRMGGLLSLLPAAPAFSLLFRPLSPQPPSPEGKGEIFCFLMHGASPLASPRLNRRRHLQSQPNRYPRGAEPARHWLSPPLWKTQWGACFLCRPPPLPLA